MDVSQFPTFAAGCLLYLSSPNPVCAATTEGGWGDQTHGFIHKLTHTEQHGGHDHMDLNGLTVLIHELHHHYQPLDTEVSPDRDETVTPALFAGENSDAAESAVSEDGGSGASRSKNSFLLNN